MTSRERMLAAISGKTPDYVPCSFMIFSAMNLRSSGPEEVVEAQVKLGLDPVVNLPYDMGDVGRRETECGDLAGYLIQFGADVRVKDWIENPPGERYPVLHREYDTPAGKLTTAVNKTEDWIQGDRVPLFDDFVIPRARKRLVTTPRDLEALRYLLPLPTAEARKRAAKRNARAHAIADKHGLVVAAGWGALFDAACWIAGMEDLIVMALDNPEFFRALIDRIGKWNLKRMEVMLEAHPHLFIRRAWYETTAFLSPSLYREFILPFLKREVALAHEAGAKFGLISTSAYNPLLDMYMEAGADVLIGLDPVQDNQADFSATKARTRGRLALWGGVNGFVTVERGSPMDVRQSVRSSMELLAPGGGFILSPVDNVTRNEPLVWANVDALIDEWRKCRDYPFKSR